MKVFRLLERLFFSIFGVLIYKYVLGLIFDRLSRYLMYKLYLWFKYKIQLLYDRCLGFFWLTKYRNVTSTSLPVKITEFKIPVGERVVLSDGWDPKVIYFMCAILLLVISNACLLYALYRERKVSRTCFVIKRRPKRRKNSSNSTPEISSDEENGESVSVKDKAKNSIGKAALNGSVVGSGNQPAAAAAAAAPVPKMAAPPSSAAINEAKPFPPSSSAGPEVSSTAADPSQNLSASVKPAVNSNTAPVKQVAVLKTRGGKTKADSEADAGEGTSAERDPAEEEEKVCLKDIAELLRSSLDGDAGQIADSRTTRGGTPDLKEILRRVTMRLMGQQVQGEEEEEEEDDIDSCSSPRDEIRNVRKDYIRADKEPILAWLGRCYDTGAPALMVGDKSAAQLGTLSKDNGIDRHLGRTLGKVNLWIRLLMATLMRYPTRDDLPWNPKPWTTIEEGIKRLREFAVREVLYGGHETLNPDEIPVGTGLAKKLIKLAPPNYANILASRIVARNYGGAPPTVGQFTDQMRQLEDSMTRVSLVSAIETLSGTIENCTKELKDELKNTISQLTQR